MTRTAPSSTTRPPLAIAWPSNRSTGSWS